MAVIFPNPAMEDLKLTIQESGLIFPSKETKKRTIFMSNIDQLPNYYIPNASFFTENPKFPANFVTQRLKLALENVLVTFDFMAGRLKWNPELDRMELDCNSAGVGFVVASSEFTLEELGDLGRPNLGFRQLAAESFDDSKDRPLCAFQVTSFKCGGFAIGASVNHCLFDGMGAKYFYEILASQAFDEERPFPYTPFFDRTIFTARSPPVVSYEHPEFLKLDLTSNGPPVFDCAPEKLDYLIFKFRPADIAYLKEKATNRDSETAGKTRISSFLAATALLWRCKVLSYDNTEDRVSTLLTVVDLRTRVDPPPPPSYCANAIICAYSSAECGDIVNGPFWKLVEKVGEGPARVTSDYAKSALDWVQINKGIPYGEYMVSSWLSLGFEKVAYPWGKPFYSCPVVSHRKDICWVFPDKEGINAFVSLPPTQMEVFKNHFEDFFKT